MKKSLFTLLLLCFQAHIFAQEYGFYFGGTHQLRSSVHYLQENSSTFVRTLFLPGDTLWEVSKRRYSSHLTYEFQTLPGWMAGVDMKWAVKKRWGIRTGVGIATGKIMVQQRNSNSEFITLSVDTLQNNPYGSPSIFNTTCDRYTNSPSSLGDLDYRPHFSTSMLTLPVAAQFQLIPENVKLDLGIQLVTPLRIRRSRETFSVETETDANGDLVCTWVKTEQVSTTGEDFNDANFGAFVQASYWAGDLGIAIGGEKRLNDIFSTPKTEATGYQAKPFFYSLRLMYELGKNNRAKS